MKNQTYDIFIKALKPVEMGVLEGYKDEQNVPIIKLTKDSLSLDNIGKTIFLLRSKKDFNYIKLNEINYFKRVGRHRYILISPYVVKVVKEFPKRTTDIKKRLESLNSDELTFLERQLEFLFKGVNPYMINSKVLNNWMKHYHVPEHIRLATARIWTLQRKFETALKYLDNYKGDKNEPNSEK